jgi:type IV pilus assembly protein PilA
MKNNQQGFTLIELLIVVAIIAILSTMALPSYQDRTIRAQVAMAITMAEPAKREVEDYYRAKGTLPQNNAQAGLPKPDKFVGNYVESLTVHNGVIEIALGNRINQNVAGKTLVLRPAIVSESAKVPIAWVCGAASVPKGMTVAAKNTGTLMARHMPVECRY